MSERIRMATRGDARAIAEVQVASWHTFYRGLMPDAKLDAFTLEAREAAWREILAGESRSRTTVLEREHVVAFASVGPSRHLEGWGEIWALYAHPDAVGTGAGRALCEEGLSHLAERGFSRIMLWVLEGNVRAIRFYEAAGFHLDGGTMAPEDLPHLRMIKDNR